MEKNNLIYGIHAVLETLREGKPIDQILIKKQSDNELIREIIYNARKQGVTVKSVPYEKIQRITQKNHQGVLAFLSPIEFADIHDIVPHIFEEGKVPLIVLLDSITDVRNFGAIARTCECLGVHAIVIPQKGAAQINADAVKTSAGALHKIPICKTKSLTHACNFLQDSGIQIIAASEKYSKMCKEINFTLPTALEMGAEEDGISKPILDLCDEHIGIPMFGNIGSLNVSVATGICLYEAVRQRSM